MSVATKPTMRPSPIKANVAPGKTQPKIFKTRIPTSVMVNKTIDSQLSGTAFFSLPTAIKSRIMTPIDKPLNAA